MHRTTRVLTLSALTLGLAGCGGGGGGNPIGPPPFDPSGDWQATWTDAINGDPCNLHTSDAERADVRITLQGNNAMIQDEGVRCGPGTAPYDPGVSGFHLKFNDSGDSLGPDGCTYHEDRFIEVIVSETQLTGRTVESISLVSGTGCLYLPQPACTLDENLTGARCQGCYDGCMGTASAPSRFSSGGGEAGIGLSRAQGR